MSRNPIFRGGGARRWFVCLGVAFFGAMGHERTALAEDAGNDSNACIDAYEQAQERRLEGALLDARRKFATCSRDACPAFIHADCTRFFEEVNVEVASASFQ